MQPFRTCLNGQNPGAASKFGADPLQPVIRAHGRIEEKCMDSTVAINRRGLAAAEPSELRSATLSSRQASKPNGSALTFGIGGTVPNAEEMPGFLFQ